MTTETKMHETVKKVIEDLEFAMPCKVCGGDKFAVTPGCKACFHREYRRNQKTRESIRSAADVCAAMAEQWFKRCDVGEAAFFQEAIQMLPKKVADFPPERLTPYVKILIDNISDRYPGIDEDCLYFFCKRMILAADITGRFRVIDEVNRILDERANRQKNKVDNNA